MGYYARNYASIIGQTLSGTDNRHSTILWRDGTDRRFLGLSQRIRMVGIPVENTKSMQVSDHSLPHPMKKQSEGLVHETIERIRT